MRKERVVLCSVPGCEEPAEFKIAAPWSDDEYQGLRTYGFSCTNHLRMVFEDAESRWLEYEPVPEETVFDLGIFRFEPCKGDRHLERDHEQESIFRI